MENEGGSGVKEGWKQDSTDGSAVALYPADPGSNPVVSMLQRALWLSVSADRPN